VDQVRRAAGMQHLGLRCPQSLREVSRLCNKNDSPIAIPDSGGKGHTLSLHTDIVTNSTEDTEEIVRNFGY
jgi:hypothetical protein